MTKYQYLKGFGNHFESEAVPDSLPKDQNTPQVCPRGLYAEQLSGTAFTVPRAKQQRSWLYRIRPSAMHRPFQVAERGEITAEFGSVAPDPNQIRWRPYALPDASTEKVDFVRGIKTLMGAGSPGTKTGMAVHVYCANTSMADSAFCNADGDFLLVPQQGALDIRTEFGCLYVVPGEICVIQRGIRFTVALPDGPSRGYIAEVFAGHFVIPDLGPIGANGLANPRDFRSPVAAYEDVDKPFRIIHKYEGHLYVAHQAHSPYDVVAWHGNYVPYKYDLALFCAFNSVTFDHPDPSVFTVLTCPSNEPGVAVCDFVIFPPRWMCHEHTFRPPYFHRNVMSEFMGLIRGKYEAKEGFQAGGGSLHSCMTPHGPDADTFLRGSAEDTTKPVRLPDSTLAFMFESTYMLRVTEYAESIAEKDSNYFECWQGLPKNFKLDD